MSDVRKERNVIWFRVFAHIWARRINNCVSDTHRSTVLHTTAHATHVFELLSQSFMWISYLMWECMKCLFTIDFITNQEPSRTVRTYLVDAAACYIAYCRICNSPWYADSVQCTCPDCICIYKPLIERKLGCKFDGIQIMYIRFSII